MEWLEERWPEISAKKNNSRLIIPLSATNDLINDKKHIGALLRSAQHFVALHITFFFF